MKSACSHVALWAFATERLLPAVRYFHDWPHQFREKVYYESHRYRVARRNFARSRFQSRTIIQFTRDPAARLVSIFRHVCRHDFLWDQIKRKVDVDVAQDGLSLADFDRFLHTQNLSISTAANPHICVQRHPLQRLKVDRRIVVNIDTHDLGRALHQLEAEFALNVNHKQLDRAVAALSTVHYATDRATPRSGSIETYRFRRDETDAFPKTEIGQSGLLQDMSRRHYAADYGLVDTKDSAGRLFAD